jgi:DNA-binding transcriptional ArsR family regulator
LSAEQKMKVHLKLDSFETDIEGSPEEVALEVNRIASQLLPTFNIARKVFLNFSLSDLINKFGDFVKITPEGPRVVTDKPLSDKIMIALQLVAVKMHAETGKQGAGRTTLQELERTTGLNPKSISSRLSELVKAGYVERVVVEDGTFYFINTVGIDWLAKQLPPHK